MACTFALNAGFVLGGGTPYAGWQLRDSQDRESRSISWLTDGTPASTQDPRSASCTSLTQVFGAGPVVAGTIAGDVARFPGRYHFASCSPACSRRSATRCHPRNQRTTKEVRAAT
jgi:hypothetical protein